MQGCSILALQSWLSGRIYKILQSGGSLLDVIIQGFSCYLVQYDFLRNLTLAPALSSSFEITTLTPLHLQYLSLCSTGTKDDCTHRWTIQWNMKSFFQFALSVNNYCSYLKSGVQKASRHRITLSALEVCFMIWPSSQIKFVSLSPLSMPFSTLEEPLNTLWM